MPIDAVRTSRAIDRIPPRPAEGTAVPLRAALGAAPDPGGLDALAARMDLYPQMSWADSETGVCWLGLGEADALAAEDAGAAWTLPGRARRRLASVGAPPEVRALLRYLGGIAFDPAAGAHPEWPAGGPGRFVLPRILIRREPGRPDIQIVATIRADAPEGAEATEIARVRDLLRERGRDGRMGRLDAVESPGSRARWEASVRAALTAIGSGALRKVVLSRDLRLQGRDTIDPWVVMDRIRSRAPHGFVFCFRFDPGAAFLGATPERLVSQRARAIACDCLAGTVSRGASGAEDERAGARLLSSEKDRREHRLVLDGILAALAPLSRWAEAPSSPAILPLPRILHLSTPVRGWLRAGVTLDELLHRLHPTPAVGGSPTPAALRMIRELEGRPRGWYAGPVGWIAEDGADFAVGIRSAIVRGDRATVIGGAGIVEGSDPAAEWDETARKAASFLSLFTREER